MAEIAFLGFSSNAAPNSLERRGDSRLAASTREIGGAFEAVPHAQMAPEHPSIGPAPRRLLQKLSTVPPGPFLCERYRWFESMSLQQRVACETDFLAFDRGSFSKMVCVLSWLPSSGTSPINEKPRSGFPRCPRRASLAHSRAPSHRRASWRSRRQR
jgi:hypothetical protein